MSIGSTQHCPNCGQWLGLPSPPPPEIRCPSCGGTFAPGQAVQQRAHPITAPAAGQAVIRPAQRSNFVTPPAVGLLVVGVLATFLSVLNLISVLAAGDDIQVPPPWNNNPQMVEGFKMGAKLAPYLAPVQILLGTFTAVSGFLMLNRRKYGLSVAGSIVAMLPFTACCMLGIPIGIWAIVVLSRDDVKREFR